jgi:hypothetical protein
VTIDVDEIPEGFNVNGPSDHAAMSAVLAKVWKEVEGMATALAIVVVLPDGKITAALAATGIPELAKLMNAGPETFRLTVERMAAGRGHTTVLPAEDKKDGH